MLLLIFNRGNIVCNVRFLSVPSLTLYSPLVTMASTDTSLPDAVQLILEANFNPEICNLGTNITTLNSFYDRHISSTLLLARTSPLSVSELSLALSTSVDRAGKKFAEEGCHFAPFREVKATLPEKHLKNLPAQNVLNYYKNHLGKFCAYLASMLILHPKQPRWASLFGLSYDEYSNFLSQLWLEISYSQSRGLIANPSFLKELDEATKDKAKAVAIKYPELAIWFSSPSAMHP